MSRGPMQTWNLQPTDTFVLDVEGWYFIFEAKVALTLKGALGTDDIFHTIELEEAAGHMQLVETMTLRDEHWRLFCQMKNGTAVNWERERWQVLVTAARVAGRITAEAYTVLSAVAK